MGPLPCQQNPEDQDDTHDADDAKAHTRRALLSGLRSGKLDAIMHDLREQEDSADGVDTGNAEVAGKEAKGKGKQAATGQDAASSSDCTGSEGTLSAEEEEQHIHANHVRHHNYHNRSAMQQRGMNKDLSMLGEHEEEESEGEGEGNTTDEDHHHHASKAPALVRGNKDLSRVLEEDSEDEEAYGGLRTRSTRVTELGKNTPNVGRTPSCSRSGRKGDSSKGGGRGRKNTAPMSVLGEEQDGGNGGDGGDDGYGGDDGDGGSGGAAVNVGGGPAQQEAERGEVDPFGMSEASGSSSSDSDSVEEVNDANPFGSSNPFARG